MRGSCEPLIPLNGCKGTKKFLYGQIFSLFSFAFPLNSEHIDEAPTPAPRIKKGSKRRWPVISKTANLNQNKPLAFFPQKSVRLPERRCTGRLRPVRDWQRVQQTDRLYLVDTNHILLRTTDFRITRIWAPSANIRVIRKIRCLYNSLQNCCQSALGETLFSTSSTATKLFSLLYTRLSVCCHTMSVWKVCRMRVATGGSSV